MDAITSRFVFDVYNKARIEANRMRGINANGVILWDGASWDREPIACVVTGLTKPSSNMKTGDGPQTWIVRRNWIPSQEGTESVCLDCPHQGNLASYDAKGADDTGACYVNKGQAPYRVWGGLANGRYLTVAQYPTLLLYNLLRGRIGRIGSYGEPALVPQERWELFAALCGTTTGYTHQWRIAPRLKRLCMASCDNLEEAEEALSAGWNVFLTIAEDGEEPRGWIECPASVRDDVKCYQCRQCVARGHGRKLFIRAHGLTACHFKASEPVSFPHTFAIA